MTSSPRDRDTRNDDNRNGPPAGRESGAGSTAGLPTAIGVDTAALTAMLVHWLPAQRWFSAKGSALGEIRITDRTPVGAAPTGADVEQVLFTVSAPAGALRYQLWVGWHQDMPEALRRAEIGTTGRWTAYDALHDSSVAGLAVTAMQSHREVAGLRFSVEPGVQLDPAATGLVIGAEQSNTSIVYGSDSILKVFRRLEPGPNPDAEIHRALHAAGSTHVAAPLGIIEGPVDGIDTTLGLLTSFFAGSAEGWTMATASVRDLLAEGDLRADEVGGDFAAEARRLGRAVAEVHADLAEAFGTETLTGTALTDLLDGMAQTARATATHVPSIAAHLDAILAAFAAAGRTAADVPVQRIHGDLHLGQTLRVLTGWAIIDFEGEPAKPLAFRRARHSPLRDVAGMLRSFDYAAHHSLAGGEPGAQHLYRAAEWAARNRSAFCDGYTAVAGRDPRDSPALLAAFELDKAVYEVAYEHGHRPSWEPIPLQAVTRLTNPGGKS